MSRMRLRYASSEDALIVMFAAPKNSGSSCARTVILLTTPKVPPPPPFKAQNRSGLVHALAIRIWPSAVTTSASSKLRSGGAIALGVASKAAALDLQTREADGWPLTAEPSTTSPTLTPEHTTPG